MKNFFLRIAKILTILLFTWIVIFSLFMQSKYLYNDSPTFIKTNIFNYISIFINIGVIAGVYFLSKKIKLDIKIYMLIYFILGLILIFTIQLHPFSDSQKVYEIGISNFTAHPDYVAKNKNNIPTIVFIQVLALITKSTTGMRIINIFQNLLIAYLTYKIAEIVFEKKEKFYLIFTLMNIPIFLYINSIYNNVPYALFSIWVIYLILKPERRKVDIVFAIVFSVIAFMLRPVYIINMIAIMMYEVINKKEWKFPIIYLVACVLLIVGCNKLIELRFGKLEESYPAWSFMQMGFNEAEFGFQDHSHSCDYTYKDVIEKIKKLGPKKVLEIVSKKETWMFTEGTYQAARYSFGDANAVYTVENAITKDLRKIDDSIIRDCLEYLMRGQYFIIILLSIISLLKNKNEKTVVMNYIIVGMFCFYIFWEIKSRYIYVLYPIFSLYAVNGLEIIVEYVKKASKHKMGLTENKSSDII